MKTIILAALATFISISAFAQNVTPLPKDLPPYGPEKPLQAPVVKSVTLENGLTIWLVSQPGLPKIAFSVAVRGGYSADPADRPGISELLASTLDQGTKTRSAKQIAQELQAAGGDLGGDTRKDYTEVSTTILSSKAEAAVTILADVLQNATFPDTEVALVKRNAADNLRMNESDPSFLASRATAKALFGSHPYYVNSPTQESIAAATASELRAIYSQRFRPDQVAMMAVGDFENEKMLALLKSKFKGWKAPSSPPVAAAAPVTAPPSHSVFVVDRPDSVQATIEFAASGPLRGAPDFAATNVANAIYGGTFSSRLTNNIREDKGYTYTPFAMLGTFKAAGAVFTRADVRNEVVGPCFNEIAYELNRMATTSPTDEELSKAKRYLVGIQAIELQARSAVAHELATIWVDGLPPEEIGARGQRISATTAAEVNAAARKYFPASRTAIVVIGQEKVIREALEPFGLPTQTLK